MTRHLALFLVFALCHTTWADDNATAKGRILVDASKDGGVWWFPQGGDGFDPAQHHQGKKLADYLKSRGWEVEELPRGQNVTERLKGAAIVICPSPYSEHTESEVRAYRDYVTGGGRLLLLQGFMRDGEEARDTLAKNFGIVFSKIVRAPTIKKWAQHPLTKDLELLRYQIGSIITESPNSTVPIAYLDNDELVMGIATVGKGKVFFASTILPLLQVPQPFMDRAFEELSRKN